MESDNRIFSVSEEDFYIVNIRGRVDSSMGFDALKTQCTQLVNRGGRAGKVIIDLTGTTYIDSLGLGVIVSTWQKVKKSEGTLKIVCSDQRIREILNRTSIDRFIPVFEHRQDARASFADVNHAAAHS